MEAVQKVEIPMSDLAELLQLQIREGGIAVLTVTGSSMVPMLENRRDKVWLTRLIQAPKRGDVILYRRENGQYVLHRVIQSEDVLGCVCCGDNDWKTELVHKTDIMGIVRQFTHRGRVCTVQNWKYRLYAWLWTRSFSIRKPLLLARRQLGKWKRACQARK